MSFDRDRLRSLMGQHGAVVRVVVAETSGSAPRETGAAMTVWADGQDGTIGGGALEWAALSTARRVLAERRDRVERVPLGPALQQCCGGAVTLLYECWDAARLAAATGDIVARAAPGGPEAMPMAVHRLTAAARGNGRRPVATMVQGWMVEPVTQPSREIWVWGAGHVGRAIVGVLQPLPDLGISWVDTDRGRFPDPCPPGVAIRIATDPVTLAKDAPVTADHLILTFSHVLDLALCHALLQHGFRSAGLIGSASKWARFRSRLAALGHPPDAVARITCPIGDPALGKHPQAIAVGVAARLLLDGHPVRAAADPALRRQS